MHTMALTVYCPPLSPTHPSPPPHTSSGHMCRFPTKCSPLLPHAICCTSFSFNLPCPLPPAPPLGLHNVARSVQEAFEAITSREVAGSTSAELVASVCMALLEGGQVRARLCVVRCMPVRRCGRSLVQWSCVGRVDESLQPPMHDLALPVHAAVHARCARRFVRK